MPPVALCCPATGRKNWWTMAKSKSKTTSTPAWPDERFRSETPKGKTFTAYAVCPFDPIWGIEQWGYEIHGSRETGIFQDKHDNDREVPVVRLTGSLPRKATYVEQDCPGWTLPAGLTLTPPFSEAAETLLRQLHLVDEYADTFTPLTDRIRAALTMCHVEANILTTLTGARIERILRQHTKDFGVGGDGRQKGRKRKYSEQTLKLAETMYDARLVDLNDSKAAWSEVANAYGFPSWEAARKRVSQWKHGQK